LEANDVTRRLAAEERVAPQKHERPSRDHDRSWIHETREIAHANALAASASSKADIPVADADCEGSKRRIADLQVVHSKTRNGE
jgi:hypothetical protein